MSLPQALYCWDITPFATLTARRHTVEGAIGGEGGANREEEHHRVSDVEEMDQENGARSYRHQRRGDRKTKRQRHTGGRRRTGDRSRRRRGRRRNRKNRRRQQNRARTQEPDYDAGNQTAEVAGLGLSEGGRNSAAEGEVSVSQGTRRLGEHTLGGEMLADSPKNPPHDSFVEESNAIATAPQEAATRTSSQRPGNRGRGKEERRRKGRRRKGKKGRSKERERKKRKRERRRKRKERRRRRLQLKKRKKKRERRKGKRGKKYLP